MGLFICSKCNCIENTALGWWWSKDTLKLTMPPEMKEYEKGKGLCSECLPVGAKFSDGTDVGGKGKWHGKFPKQTADEFMNGEGGKHYKRRENGYLDYIGN